MSKEIRQLKIYMLEAGKINPERDAGARADQDFVDICRQSNIAIELIDLSRLFDAQSFFKQRDKQNVCFVSSRPGAGLMLASARVKDSKKIYMGHDLHFRRLQQWKSLELDDAPTLERISLIHRAESICWGAHDISLYPSVAEVELLQVKGVNASYWPYFKFDIAKQCYERSQFKGVFIGSYTHKPNQDGLACFLDTIWPYWIEMHPTLILDIVGNWPESFISRFHKRGLNWLGQQTEASVEEIFSQASWSVVPLRFGAGIKRKLLQALNHGLTVFSTPVGVHGLPEKLPSGCIVAELQDWLEMYRLVLRNDMSSDSMQNIAYVHKHYGSPGMATKLIELLETLNTDVNSELPRRDHG